MARKKVKLAFISNDSSRKTTFNKRKKGLIKKANELSTLCGVNACAVIYSQFDSNPEVWPSPSSVQRVVSDFKMLPEIDQQKNMVDQVEFVRQMIEKASEHLKREMKENREMEMKEVMFQSLAGKMWQFPMNILDFNDFGYIIDRYINDLNRRAEFLRNSGIEIGESSNAAVGGSGTVVARSVTNAQTTTTIEVGSSSTFEVAANFFNHIQQHQHQYQQQQFLHPMAPPFGRYEQFQNLNHNQHQLLMETTNHPEERNYVEQMSSVMDNNHHNHQQEHHSPVESSTASVNASTTTIIPITSPNEFR